MNNKPKKIKQRQEDRFAKIARLGELVFHTQDLAGLWQIKNPNTLYTLIKRYKKKDCFLVFIKDFIL